MQIFSMAPIPTMEIHFEVSEPNLKFRKTKIYKGKLTSKSSGWLPKKQQ